MNGVERDHRPPMDFGFLDFRCGRVRGRSQKKKPGCVFFQCNAVRSVHEGSWQREAACAVASDVTGRP